MEPESESYEKMYNAWLEATKKFLSPWSSVMGSGPSSNPFQTPFSSPMQMPDFGKEWSKTMEKMMFSFPASMMLQGTAGPAAMLQKDYWDLMNDSIDLYKESADLSTAFSKVWLQTSASVFEKFATIATKVTSLNPEELTKQTYNLWVEEAESKMDQLLRDSVFSQKLAGLLSKYLDVKKKSDLITEKYLKLMNIPTRTEIDNIYKELHNISRKLSDLSASTSSAKDKKEEEKGK